MACKTLSELSIAGLTVIEGGIEAFARAGGETEKGRAVVSIERQVRIAAGSLVVLGVALGSFVHPAFTLLAAVVGGGLIFAGATDWCGMGLMLARAPWNRSSSESPGSGGACAASLPSASVDSAPSDNVQ